MKKNSREEDFEAALRQYEGAIYDICFIYTDRTSEDVNDLFQEIVYNLWKSYSSRRGDSALTTWFYGVALNVARHHRASRLRSPQFVKLDPAICENMVDEPPDEQQQRLYELIGRLPKADKKVVALYLDGRSVKDMAKALHCSESTVNRRIRYIKEKLKKMNEQEDFITPTLTSPLTPKS